MPAQILIHKLTRAQVEKAVVDASMQDRLALQDYEGRMLLIVDCGEGTDPEAHAVLQKIADADSALTQKAQKALADAEAAEKAKTAKKP